MTTRERGAHGAGRSPARADRSDLYERISRFNEAWLEATEQDAHVPLPKPTREFAPFGPDDELSNIHSVALVHRLGYIKQLSTVSWTKHLAANHTRLLHAAGTARVALGVLRILETDRDIKSHFGEDEIPTYELYRRACIVLAFVHDLFHGPLGHSLDFFKDIFASPASKLDDTLLQEALREARAGIDTRVAAQLRNMVKHLHKEDPDGLLNALYDLTDPARIESVLKGKLVFLRDLISSALDADRIDYIQRDSKMLEAGRTCEREIDQLLDSVTVVKENECLRLAYPLDSRDQLSTVLNHRRHLYANYYEAPEKLIVDDMICHALYYILEDIKAVPSFEDLDAELLGASGLAAYQVPRKFKRHLLLLTDEDFFPALYALEADPVCYEMVRRIQNRQFYRSILKVDIKIDQVDQTLALYKRWMGRIGEKWREIVEQRGRKEIKPDDAELYKEVSDSNRAHITAEPRKTAMIERLRELERELLDKYKDNQEQRQRISAELREYREAIRRDEEELWELLRRPGSPAITTEALANELRSVADAEGETHWRRLLIYAFQWATNANFLLRHQIERRAWRNFREKEASRTVLLSYVRTEYGRGPAAEYGAAVANAEPHSLDDRIDRHPPLHISTSSFFALVDKERLAQYYKEGDVGRPLFVHNGAPRREPIRRQIWEDDSALPLLLAVPRALACADGAAGILREAFWETLESLDWLVAKVDDVDGALAASEISDG